MNLETAKGLCARILSREPESVERCGVGIANYVYKVECAGEKYILRCSTDNDYSETAAWLRRLAALDIPVPRVMEHGEADGYRYLLLTYIPGQDIGLVYRQLSENEKREIAREVVEIQKKASKLEPEGIGPDWSWTSFIEGMLDRAAGRILDNGYFSVERVDRLRAETERFKGYFSKVKPVAYLDDITTKNLLVHNGRLSGVIDVDWIGVGDPLTQPALTCMALMDLECDTDYAGYILEGMEPKGAQRRAFIFYLLMYCVDFMGERGTTFMDKKIEVNGEIIRRLNDIYDRLWVRLNDMPV